MTSHDDEKVYTACSVVCAAQHKHTSSAWLCLCHTHKVTMVQHWQILSSCCLSEQDCQTQSICYTSATLVPDAYSMHITEVMFQSLIEAHTHLGTRLGAPPLQQ